MADSAYPYDTGLVRELLKNKRKSRGIRSCFPCRHRKVRCDGQVPCSSCVKRSHPELCRVPTSSETGNEDYLPSASADVPQGPSQHYSSTNLENDTLSTNPGDATAVLISRLEAIEEQIASLKADLLATAAATTTTPASQPSPRTGSVARLPGMRVRPASKSPGRYVVEDATGATIYLGRHADAPLALGCRQTTMSAMAGDLSLQDVLINQCMPRAYPFINLWGAEATLSDVCQTLPEDSDVIRYWQAYQTKAYPFYPALAAIDEFAQALFAFLDQRMLAHEAMTPPEEPSSSWMALLFAVLACGVQFSDDPIQERDLRSKVLVCSSFQCLRMSNFFYQTNTDQIQAMALIGHCLRNNLDTNSAWILMGATIRLAQSIGLHEASPSLPEAEQFERSRLWWMLIWQDTFLSFTYDRPLGTIAMNCSIPYKHDTDGLSFQECVFAICHQIIEEARQETTDGPQDPLESMRESKRQLDGIRDAAAPFLVDKRRCVSLQDHLERLALDIHLGYVTCRINRVYLDGHTGAPFPTAVAVDCVQRAMQAIESFLDLHRYSASVCRSWAFVHNAVSCAITLKSLNHVPVDERRKSDLLVQRLIAVLEKEEKESEWCDDDTNVRYFGPYSRALKALREICHSAG
ncbi:Zn(II)2Cys6 transcription factor [Aspergillus vadensis CBS 113365]|uniref:Zn(II)2Cys6 transcription factor n=1 Tax=Aspergillus vadensis (strain CBS 113365 / IMI 142717 / IBT 24658) TaxID=1448311 RepID=A0A319BWS1_ASPVC|nr:Zn(II)2Cys6 transcription factor [Aspergillus vadensis CBS 113365]PYH70323.1 Zn(II)2Cys6 transcription factor [Aspergillus vadensis CBS 113365]